MKIMKFVKRMPLGLFVGLVVLSGFIGCPDASSELSDADKVQEALKALDIVKVAGGDLLTVTGPEFKLPTTGANKTTITWTSDKEAISIDPDGTAKVTRPAAGAADVEVILTATITLNGESAKTTFTLKVLEELSDEDSVAADTAALDIAEAAGGNLDKVTGPTITLPANGLNGTSITWSSNNAAITINENTATVNRQSGSVVVLTATVTKGAASDTRTFILTVLPADRAPGAPGFIGAIAKDEEVEVSWTAPTDTGIIKGDGTTGTITKYTVYWGVTYDIIGDITTGNSPNKIDVASDTTTHTITGLTNGDEVSFIVTASNASGESAAFSKESATPWNQTVPVTGVTISDKSTTEVTMGETLKLRATVLPAEASNTMLTWSSGDTTLVTVNNSGVVTPVAVGGPITITVTSAADNTKSDSIDITVKAITINSLVYEAITGTEDLAITAVSPTIDPVGATGTFSVTSGTLPSGLSLDSDSGEISGTPDQATNGVVSVTIEMIGTDNYEGTVTKDVDITIEVGDATLVATDKAALTITYAQGDSETSVTQALTLPAAGANGTSITWSSSDTNVIAIADDGAVTVTRPADADASVTLTATIEKGGASETKDFTLTVLKDAGLSDADAVAAAINALDITTAAGGNLQAVTVAAITLPVAGTEGTTITWSSDNAAIAISGNTATVTRPDVNSADADVTLTATIEKGGETDTKAFSLKVLKEAGLSDADAVAADKDALTITYAQGDTVTSVTQDLTLVTGGSNGTTISWVSSNTAVIANDGTVTRPDVNSADADVTLTATIEKGGVTDKKIFNLKVLKEAGLSDADAVAAAKTALDITAAVGGNLQAVTLAAITLPVAGTEGTTISWVSSNTAVIANDGTVTRPDVNSADADVTLTATIEKGGETDTKAFSLKVLKEAGLSDADAVAADKDALTITYAQGDTVTSVTQDLTLVTGGSNGTTISWVSSNTAVIANDGTVTRPAADATVKLTATISKGTATDEKVFDLKVLSIAVSGLSPTDGATTTDTTPAFSWNAVPGAAGYEVQIAASEAGLANAQAVEVSGTSYTPSTALANKQTHYWRVRAKDGDEQYGTWSAVASILIAWYAVGDTGPAGGIVFYDKGSYSDGWRFLEAAKSNQATSAEWGGYGTSVGETSTGIGSGKANTEKIVQALGDGNYAAKICDDLVLGGQDDWFLPSKDELNELYKQKSTVGGFTSSTYWSSSEASSGKAWGQDFYNGSQYDTTKDYGRRVRAVRAF